MALCSDKDIATILRDVDINWLVTTSQGNLEMKMAKVEVTNEDVLALAGCTLDTHPGEKNWVEDNGGLPEYICEIARSIAAKRGKSISNAIQIAVGVVKRWAKGVGDVNADTRAKAAAAVAQWEALKAKAHAKDVVKTSRPNPKKRKRKKQKQDLNEVALATMKVWIAKHPSTVDGKPVSVEGHWRTIQVSPGASLPSTGTAASKKPAGASTASSAASSASSSAPSPASDVQSTVNRALGADPRFERAPDLGDGIPDEQGVLALRESVVPQLQEGEVFVIGKISKSAPSTNQVMIAIDSEGRLRVVKPKSGFKEGPEEAHREIGQELAALAISNALGNPCRLPDVQRNEDATKLVGARSEGMEGGFQDAEYIPNSQLWDRVSPVAPADLPEGSPERAQAETDAGFGTMDAENRHRIAFLDAVLGNVDRHAGNIGTSDDPPPPYIAIDHGRTMPDVTEPQDAQVKKGRPPITLTQWMSQNAPDELTLAEGDRTALENMLANWDQLEQDLLASEGVTPESIKEMRARAEYMLTANKVMDENDFATRPWATGEGQDTGADVLPDVEAAAAKKPVTGGKTSLPPGYTPEAAAYEKKTAGKKANEGFAPGYTSEAAAYEKATKGSEKKPLAEVTKFEELREADLMDWMKTLKTGMKVDTPSGPGKILSRQGGSDTTNARFTIELDDNTVQTAAGRGVWRATIQDLAKANLERILKKAKKGLNSSVGNTKLTAAIDELRAIVSLSAGKDE